MVRCAQLYYDTDLELSQAEVAKRLGVNPTRVSRLLRQAQLDGIVQISINYPRLQGLELALVNEYDLREAIVVPSGDHGVYEAVGQAAAQYFIRIAQNDLSIGLAPGYSIQRMLECLDQLTFTGHRIYPLAAESTSQIRFFYPTQLASLLMTKYQPDSGVAAYAYRIPTRPSNEADWASYRVRLNAITNDPGFKDLVSQAGRADICLMGVGDLGQPGPAMKAFGQSYELDMADLRAKGAVGMINYQFYDADGRILTSREVPSLSSVEGSMVCIPLTEFRDAAKRFGRSLIAVAGGGYKSVAVSGALRGGFFNVLITDVDVAENLLAA